MSLKIFKQRSTTQNEYLQTGAQVSHRQTPRGRGLPFLLPQAQMLPTTNSASASSTGLGCRWGNSFVSTPL